MFVVFCRRHQRQVLLFPDNIDELMNQPDGHPMAVTHGSSTIRRVSVAPLEDE
jgi:hypothetical protein